MGSCFATELHAISSASYSNARALLTKHELPRVVEYSHFSTDIIIKNNFDEITTVEAEREYEAPTPNLSRFKDVVADSTPLEIWEGTVIAADFERQVMKVNLDAKMEVMPRHIAEISLEWVSDQDKSLIVPGAVFYLTLFKRTKKGTIENAQELRFRRLPSWSLSQLQRVKEDAKKIKSKMKSLPRAE